MPLTEFEVVDRQEHVDDSVVIGAKDGKDRVVAFVGREGSRITAENIPTVPT